MLILHILIFVAVSHLKIESEMKQGNGLRAVIASVEPKGQIKIVGGIAKSDVAMVMEIIKYAQGVEVERLGRLSHRSTQHPDGVGDVATSVHGAVQQPAHDALAQCALCPCAGTNRPCEKRPGRAWSSD